MRLISELVLIFNKRFYRRAQSAFDSRVAPSNTAEGAKKDLAFQGNFILAVRFC